MGKIRKIGNGEVIQSLLWNTKCLQMQAIYTIKTPTPVKFDPKKSYVALLHGCSGDLDSEKSRNPRSQQRVVQPRPRAAGRQLESLGFVLAMLSGKNLPSEFSGIFRTTVRSRVQHSATRRKHGRFFNDRSRRLRLKSICIIYSWLLCLIM